MYTYIKKKQNTEVIKIPSEACVCPKTLCSHLNSLCKSTSLQSNTVKTKNKFLLSIT